VSLRAWCVLPPERSSGKRLYHLLNDWMGGLEWDSYSGKFLDKEGLGRMEEEERSMEEKEGSRAVRLRYSQTYGLDSDEKESAEEAFGGYWDNGRWFGRKKCRLRQSAKLSYLQR
jgi:hypothetical protein